MTLADVREPARLIAEWCLDRDDLLGFQVQICSYDAGYRLLVDLRWPDGWHNWRAFGLNSLDQIRDPLMITNELEAMAVEARRQAARLRDPGRLP
jgi:hypothetical protein